MSKRKAVKETTAVVSITPQSVLVVPDDKASIEVEITEALAKAFARFYVDEGNNAFAACLKIWTDTALALKMSTVLPTHPLVVDEVKSVESNALNTLPSKAQFAQKLWNMIDAAETDNAKVQFMKLYADARGFIEKPAEPVNTQNVTVVLPRCIEIPSHGSDEEWAKRAQEQQRELKKRHNGQK